MRNSSIGYLALATILAGSAGAAQAQTIFDPATSSPPPETIVTQPVQIERTTETVQTVRPARVTRAVRTTRAVHTTQAVHTTASRRKLQRQISRTESFRPQVVTTRQTVVNERIVPVPTMVTPSIAGTTVATYPQPLYAAPAPLYDQAAPGPTVYDTAIAAPPALGTAIPTYRYVYEPDRILVIDPATNIAIQALPR